MSTSLLPATLTPVEIGSLDASGLAQCIDPKMSTYAVTELPFRLADSLHGRPPAELGALIFTPVKVGDATFNLLTSVDQSVLDRYVGLAGHVLDGNVGGNIEMISEALQFVHAVSCDDLQLMSAFTPNWAKLAQSPGSRGRLITSCSLPDLPLISFLSDVGWRHIPPRSVASEDDVVYAAENMIHEAVHQLVNYQILTTPVLSKDYDAASSPKISIPWRADAAEARNRSWEVDRALHAAAVYCHVLGWRARLIESGNLAPHAERIIVEASLASIKSLHVLINGIQQNLECLTKAGCYMFGHLSREAVRRCEQFDQSQLRRAALASD